MNTKEELEKLGYSMSFSQKSPVAAWGKWYVSFRKDGGPQITGYGEDEFSALDDALKTARKIEENLHIAP